MTGPDLGPEDLGPEEPHEAPRPTYDDAQVRALLARLGRPHRSGGTVIERAALAAAGADLDIVLQWIFSQGGKPEMAIKAKRRQAGLHAARDAPSDEAPLRYVLPPGALD